MKHIMMIEGMHREIEAITKDLAIKVQMQHEDENIKALMAQQNAAHHQEQEHQFHQEQEMAHQQQGHFRQGYSIDDPHYDPLQRHRYAISWLKKVDDKYPKVTNVDN